MSVGGRATSVTCLGINFPPSKAVIGWFERRIQASLLQKDTHPGLPTKFTKRRPARGPKRTTIDGWGFRMQLDEGSRLLYTEFSEMHRQGA